MEKKPRVANAAADAGDEAKLNQLYYLLYAVYLLFEHIVLYHCLFDCIVLLFINGQGSTVLYYCLFVF